MENVVVPAKNKLPPKKNLLIAGGVIALVLVIYFIYRLFFFVTTDNAQIQGKTVMLSPKVAGYVIKVNVDENQRVKAGEVLVAIDNRDLENSTEQAENEMKSLQARADDARHNSDRINQLFASGAVTRQQFETARAQSQELSRKLESVQAQFNQAKLNLTYTQIKAPSNGIIARKSVEAGMYAPVGVPLLGFVSTDERWVTANFKETELKYLKIGQRADIDVDAIPGHSFEGTVESVSPSTGAAFTLIPPDNAVGNYTKVVQRVPVRIKLEKLNEQDIELLRVGLSADVQVRVR